MKKMATHLKLLTVLCIIIAFASCDKSTEETVVKSPLDDYVANYTKWQSRKVKNYDFTHNIGCFCGHSSPYAVFVRNGVISSATNNKGEAYEPNANNNTYKFMGMQTIDQQFDFIKASLDKNPDQVKIKYNAQYGYPESVYIDFVAEMADEEAIFSVNKFNAR
jgi:hypothetical protein